MCGRFTLTADAEVLPGLFDLDEVPPLAPRYNIAPTQLAPVVRVAGSGKRELVLLRWGLIPHWADDPAIGNRLINARAETLAQKPSFRSAFRQRRCLVVADGFFEWQAVNGQKQPYYLRLRTGQPFAFAGLWEHWQDPEGKPLESCTIITTEANELVRPLHERMPVILPPADHARWLDPNVPRTEHLTALLRPFPAEAMTSFPVSRLVNSPRNDDPRCVEPVAGEGELFGSKL